jgi:hypothetical protein
LHRSANITTKKKAHRENSDNDQEFYTSVLDESEWPESRFVTAHEPSNPIRQEAEGNMETV